MAAVNNAGVVVGAAQSSTTLTAWSYDSVFGYSNLNSVINAPGWVLQSAGDINDAGQIIGAGLFNGQRNSFLLTPIPEPRAWVLTVIGVVVVAFRFKRRTVRRASRES